MTGTRTRQLPSSAWTRARQPAAAICDLLDDAGELGGLDTAVAVSERLGLARVAIADLAELRFERLWEGS